MDTLRPNVCFMMMSLVMMILFCVKDVSSTQTLKERCPTSGKPNSVSLCNNGYCYHYNFMHYSSNTDLEKINCDAWPNIKQRLQKPHVNCDSEELSYCLSAEGDDCYIGLVNYPIGSSDMTCVLKSDNNCTVDKIDKILQSFCGINGESSHGSNDGSSDGSSDGSKDGSSDGSQDGSKDGSKESDDGFLKEMCPSFSWKPVKDTDLTYHVESIELLDKMKNMSKYDATGFKNLTCNKVWTNMKKKLQESGQDCHIDKSGVSSCISSSDCYTTPVFDSLGNIKCAAKSKACTLDHLRTIGETICGVENGVASLKTVGLVTCLLCLLSLFYCKM